MRSEVSPTVAPRESDSSIHLQRSSQAVPYAIDEFRQDDRIDAVVREDVSTFIKERSREEVYSQEEEALLQRVRQKFEGSLEEGKWKELKVRSCEERNYKQRMRRWSARSEALSWEYASVAVAVVMSV